MVPIRLLFAACGALFASFIAGQAQASTFRGDAAHSGVYQSPVAPTLASVKWKFKTGAKIVSSPVVEQGSVYFGGSDHFVYALDAQTGRMKWRFETGAAVNSSPAYDANVVYVSSVDGFVYALHSDSGSLKWKFATDGERRFTAPGIHGAMPRTEMMADPFDVFLSSPNVVGGTVYVGSGDHNVYALDAATGALRWKFATGNVVHASPAVADGRVFIGSWDRYFYALDAHTGKLAWKFATGDDKEIYNQVGIASSAAVANGNVYFGCRDGRFYAVSARSGSKIWDHDNHKGWVIASPAVESGVVYFPTSDGERFLALDARTGETIFDRANKAISFSSPALAADAIVFGTSDGWLHVLDRATGQTRAEFQTDGSRQNASKYVDDKGALRLDALYPDFTLDGMMIGVDRMNSLGSVVSSPVVANGIVYFGSTDGQIYALD